MNVESYGFISGLPRELEYTRDILSNEMQHPEIFRRMEAVHRLEMGIY